MWVANNLSKESKELKLAEIKGITAIFYEFIEYYMKTPSGEEQLIDIA